MVLEHSSALHLAYSQGRTEILFNFTFFAQPEEVAENNGNVYPVPSSPPKDVVATRNDVKLMLSKGNAKQRHHKVSS